MPSKLTCPQCGHRMTMDFSTSRVYCQHCGYVRPDEIAQIEHKEQEVKAKGTHPHVEITHKGEIYPAAMAAFESGLDALYEGNKAEAIQHFLRAADLQPDFVDAHLWIAKTTDNPQVRQDHLDTVLVLMPNHLEGLRMLMVLQGKLTPEQAARTYGNEEPQAARVAASPVAAHTRSLLCPKCGGDLTVNEAARRVECRFCGYQAPLDPQSAMPEEKLLTMALLARKGQAVHWNVGTRVVHCQQCGAEHTVPAEKMSQRCRFCGSTEVIVRDALASFAQPDGIVPFGMTHEQARTALDKQLNSLGERIAGLFGNNKVAQVEMDGVYLPYWVFDVQAQLIETHTIGTQSTDLEGLEEESNVAVCGVKSPPANLTSRILPFELNTMQPYDPKWLAKYPAQLYNIDFDSASLEARGIAAQRFRRRHDEQLARLRAEKQQDELYGRRRNQEQVEHISISSQIQNMSFQLVLLPVWIATVYEADGEIRLGVINAQTSRVALGKAYQAVPNPAKPD